MKNYILQTFLALALGARLKASPVTHYVDANGTNSVASYTSWATAATNIQNAVDVSSTGDLILVTNGVYQSGSQNSFGANRVNITRVVTVQSVNGPAVTTIVGAWDAATNGPNAIRCVCLANGAALSGFTLTNGATAIGEFGGGVRCISTSAVVTNCVITGNSAYSLGGGSYYGTLVNCVVSGNMAAPLPSGGSGGGAAYGTLINCLLTQNFVRYTGGAAAYCSLVNCTVVSNSAAAYDGSILGGVLNNSVVYYNHSYYTNADDSNPTIVTNCCVSFSFSPPGANNFTNPPLFANMAGGDYHLSPLSPCINAGSNSFITTSNDLDGNPRIQFGRVDLGAYESPYNPGVHYVNAAGANPVSPFNSWTIAATNIQDAIDAATNGDLVLATNGVYQSGGRVVFGSLTNRVAINKAVTVQSVNGAAATIIQGSKPIGNNAVRCAYLTNNAVLNGFTLANGATRNIGDSVKERSGAGVLCESSGALVMNCTLVSNTANFFGGGAYSGTLSNCVVTRNTGSADEGGGAYSSLLNSCVISNNVGGGAIYCTLNNSWLLNNSGNDGGGALHCTLVNCRLIGNSAGYGGGADFSVLTNCLLFGNSAGEAGGGAADGSVLVCCTVVSNTAGHSTEGGISGSCIPRNCIVYYNNNNAGNFPNNVAAIDCCVTPLPTAGSGNITNNPLFVNPAAGDFHLMSNSPCINAGNNSYVTSATDLDGNPRISGSTVDMGAYEFQNPSSVISYAWLQQYGLPTDGSMDHTNLDGTSFNVYQDWVAGLNPTNPASVLAMSSAVSTNSASGITVTWQSVNNRTYYLQRASDLTASFSTIQSNIAGQAVTTSYADTSATNAVPYFYRVGVQ